MSGKSFSKGQVQRLGRFDAAGRFYAYAGNFADKYITAQGYRSPSRAFPYSYYKPLFTMKFYKWAVSNYPREVYEFLTNADPNPDKLARVKPSRLHAGDLVGFVQEGYQVGVVATPTIAGNRVVLCTAVNGKVKVIGADEEVSLVLDRKLYKVMEDTHETLSAVAVGLFFNQ